MATSSSGCHEETDGVEIVESGNWISKFFNDNNFYLFEVGERSLGVPVTITVDVSDAVSICTFLIFM